MDKRTCRISEKIGKMLVDQLGHELKNFQIYVTMSNYFNVNGVSDLAKYYAMRAEEEKSHYQWIVDYLNDVDYMFIAPPLSKIEQKCDDTIQIFEDTITLEIQTSDLINNIYKAASEENDPFTQQWLFKLLIPEQVEEEATSRTALDIMKSDADIYRRAKEVLRLLED